MPGSASHETPGKLLDLLPDDPTAAGLPAPAVIPRVFKGGATEWVYWGSGTAHLLPRLLRLPDGTARTRGPLFLSHRRPGEGRPGWDLHQLRHSAATHLGEDNVAPAADHGQDAPPQPPHRDALRQARR